MSKKHDDEILKQEQDVQETWPTEEEFKEDDIACGLKDDVTADCDTCSGDCTSCGGCCDTDSEDLAQKYLNIAKSVQADFENYKKRNKDIADRFYEDGRRSMILEFLPCVDAIEKAISFTLDEQTKKGLNMVENKFAEVFKTLGVTKMQTVGEIYNANFHNVLASIESDKPKDQIIEECISGYMMDDCVLRHAQVVVSKGKE